MKSTVFSLMKFIPESLLHLFSAVFSDSVSWDAVGEENEVCYFMNEVSYFRRLRGDLGPRCCKLEEVKRKEYIAFP